MQAGSLLQLWEKGHSGLPAQRTDLLTRIAGYDPAELSVGSGAAVTARLYRDLFGIADAVVDCPECSAVLEFEVPLADISDGVRAPVILEIEWEGGLINVSEPSVADLADSCRFQSLSAIRKNLIDRCLGPDAISHEGALTKIEAELEALAPSPSVEMALACPDCWHEFIEQVDLAAFFWDRLSAWACGFLREVHVLAQSYGWSESEIVQMSGARRQLYLELIAG